jgi:hypothetical protein
MTVRIGTLSVDGTPISEADLARIEAEEKLHAQQQRSAVRAIAGNALDADDCRMLLSMLGLDRDTVAAARAERAGRSGKRARRRSAAA